MKEILMPATQSHAEFTAAHLAEVAALAARRRAEVDAADALRNAANKGHADALADVTALHASEAHDRLVAFRRRAAAALVQPIATFAAEPTRAAMPALQKVLAAVEADCVASTGLPGLQWELAHALATHHLLSDPSALARFANLHNWIDHGLSVNIAVSNARALKAMRITHNPAAALAAVIELEAQVAQVGASGQPAEGDVTAQWDVFRFGGTSERIVEALATLRGAHFENVHGTVSERQAAFYAFKAAGGAITAGPKSFLDNAGDIARDLLFGAQTEPSARPSPQRAQIVAEAQAGFDQAMRAQTTRSVPISGSGFGS